MVECKLGKNRLIMMGRQDMIYWAVSQLIQNSYFTHKTRPGHWHGRSDLLRATSWLIVKLSTNVPFKLSVAANVNNK